MNENKDRQDALSDETFQFRFTRPMIAVFCLLLALCAAGFALTVWQFTEFIQTYDISSVWNWMKYLIMFFVCIFLAVLVLALMIRTRYIVTEKELITQFGIIKSRYEIKKINSVRLLNGSNKLTVFFDDFKTKYIVIVVKEIWYSDFIKALTARNEKIEFDFVTAEEENDTKKKK